MANMTPCVILKLRLTTGTTLSEASEILHAHGKKVILCLTLTDAENR